MANPKRAKKAGDVAGDGKAQSTPLETENDEELSSGEVMDDDDEDDSSHGNSEDADDTSESTDLINTVVNIDFEAFPPVDSDFHGIKKLLQQVFRNAHVNVSDLAHHLIELNKLSVILRQADQDMNDDDSDDDDDDDGDVYGISGVIPLGSDREGAKSVQNYLLEKATGGKDESIRSKLETALSTGSVALFVSERFVNIPPRVALPLLESIHGDWKEAKKVIPSLSKVQHVVMICKQYAGANEVIFANGEEELFVDLAELQFDYEVPRQDADTALAGKWKKSDEELKQIRKVLLLDMKKFPQMIRLIKENV
ncbi:protein BCCIP homolog [Varroa destructor]|uniref:Protein BCCIP homolog n=1 Tax=Varroa destructor TaxID=109461 RepID=A0A7M7J575_VARDE|nr:protein BCCIP homolog [Varroa destructor]XP_022646991.1 protein BCCIP homolog [Varroa destructor]XP_022646992.1 protein BCCIP homolog [Varroa destructor]